MTDERIINAIDRIEPEISAQRRMYDNILKKAEAKTKTVSALRIVKPLASAAACVCLVIAAAMLFKFGATDFENTASGGADGNIHVDAYAEPEAAYFNDNDAGEEMVAINADEASADILETEFNAAAVTAAPSADKSYSGAAESVLKGTVEDADAVEVEGAPSAVWAAENPLDDDVYVSLVLPDGAVSPDSENAPEASYDISEYDLTGATASAESIQELTSVDFVYGGHFYTLSASKEEDEISAAEGEIIDLQEIDLGTQAVIYSIDGGDVISFKALWSGEIYYYALSNTDGAEKDNFIDVSAKVIENNR
ncbi:MAG: hypothetical protein HDT47_07365 [Ruminococcaceae bacterium]|nr:hypothetical protein [Oscillospiraceae bacterium]